MQAVVDEAEREFAEVRRRDEAFASPRSLAAIVRILQTVQESMERLLARLPRKKHEDVAWEVLNGCTFIYKVCDPLCVSSFASNSVDFLSFALLAAEAVITLSTSKYLPMRMALFTAIFRCYFAMRNWQSAAKVLTRAREHVVQLQKDEEMDPPVPADVAYRLEQAYYDVDMLEFKLAVHQPDGPRSTDELAEKLSNYARLDGALAPKLSALGEALSVPWQLTFAESPKETQRDAWNAIAAPTLDFYLQTLETAVEQKADGEILPCPVESSIRVLEELYKAARWEDFDQLLIKLMAITGISRLPLQVATNSLDSIFTPQQIIADMPGRAPVTWTDPQRVERGDHAVTFVQLRALFALSLVTRTPAVVADLRAKANEAIAALTAARAEAREAAPPPGDAEAEAGADSAEDEDANVDPEIVRAAHEAEDALHRAPRIIDPTVLLQITGESVFRSSSSSTRSKRHRHRHTDEGGNAEEKKLEEPHDGGAPESGENATEKAAEEEEQMKKSVSASKFTAALGLVQWKETWFTLTALEALTTSLRDTARSSCIRATPTRRCFLEDIVRAVWHQFCVPTIDEQDKALPAHEAAVTEPCPALLLQAQRQIMMSMHRSLRMLKCEDIALRSLLSMRLACVLRDDGDLKVAVSVIETALTDLQAERARRVDLNIHAPEDPTDVHALSCAAISVETSNDSVRASLQRLGAHAYAGFGVFGAGSRADRADQSMAALEVDLWVSLCRIRLQDAARDARLLQRHAARKKLDADATKLFEHVKASLLTRCRHNRYWRALLLMEIARTIGAARAQIRRRLNPDADMVAGGGGGSAVVAFGGAGGSTVAPGGSVAVAGPSVTVVAPNGPGGGGSADGGPDGGADFSVTIRTATAGAGTAGGHGKGNAAVPDDVTLEEEQTEEIEQLLSEAQEALMDAEHREQTLLEELQHCYEKRPAEDSSTPGGTSSLSAIDPTSTPMQYRANPALLPPDGALPSIPRGTQLPSPMLLSRAHNFIQVRPLPVRVSKVAEIDHYRVYAKPEGAGTEVSLNSTGLFGTNIPVPFTTCTSGQLMAGAVTLFGLEPNETYVVAVAAFDEQGEVVGGIGRTSKPVDALLPLPLPLLWSCLAHVSHDLEYEKLATVAARYVYSYVVDVQRHGPAATDLSRGACALPLYAHVLRPHVVDKAPYFSLFAFIKCAHLLVRSKRFASPPVVVDTSEATVSGAQESLLGWHISQLVALRRAALAAQVACAIAHADLIVQSVWLAHEIAVPLLNTPGLEKFLLHDLCIVHQAMLLTTPEEWPSGTDDLYFSLEAAVRRCAQLLGEVELLSSLKRVPNVPFGTTPQGGTLTSEGHEYAHSSVLQDASEDNTGEGAANSENPTDGTEDASGDDENGTATANATGTGADETAATAADANRSDMDDAEAGQFDYMEDEGDDLSVGSDEVTQSAGKEALDGCRIMFLEATSAYQAKKEEAAAAEEMKHEGGEEESVQFAMKDGAGRVLVDTEWWRRERIRVVRAFRRVASLLRERRETCLLLQAQQDLGDFNLWCHELADSRQAWNDGLDALFSTLDSYKYWRDLLGTDEKRHAMAVKIGITDSLVAVTLLGKITRYCLCQTDRDAAAEHVRMAMTLVRGTFTLHASHPQSTAGFAVYVPREFYDHAQIFADSKRLSPHALVRHLELLLEVADANEDWLEALPTLALAEFIASRVLNDDVTVIRLRLCRVRFLANVGLLAEAASVLASVLSGAWLPGLAKKRAAEAEEACRRAELAAAEAEAEGGGDQKDANVDDGVGEQKADDNAPGTIPLDDSLETHTVASNGLPFFGRVPYWNHEPPHSRCNRRALRWIRNERALANCPLPENAAEEADGKGGAKAKSGGAAKGDGAEEEVSKPTGLQALLEWESAQREAFVAQQQQQPQRSGDNQEADDVVNADTAGKNDADDADRADEGGSDAGERVATTTGGTQYFDLDECLQTVARVDLESARMSLLVRVSALDGTAQEQNVPAGEDKRSEPIPSSPDQEGDGSGGAEDSAPEDDNDDEGTKPGDRPALVLNAARSMLERTASVLSLYSERSLSLWITQYATAEQISPENVARIVRVRSRAALMKAQSLLPSRRYDDVRQELSAALTFIRGAVCPPPAKRKPERAPGEGDTEEETTEDEKAGSAGSDNAAGNDPRADDGASSSDALLQRTLTFNPWEGYCSCSWWYALRAMVVTIAVRQGRTADAIEVCEDAIRESSLTRAGFWARHFALNRALALTVDGRIDDALASCRAVLEQHSQSNTTYHANCARTQAHLAHLLRESCKGEAIAGATRAKLVEAAELLWKGYSTCRQRALESGWVGIGPLTWRDIRTNKTGMDTDPPLFTAQLVHSLKEGRRLAVTHGRLECSRFVPVHAGAVPFANDPQESASAAEEDLNTGAQDGDEEDPERAARLQRQKRHEGRDGVQLSVLCNVYLPVVHDLWMVGAQLVGVLDDVGVFEGRRVTAKSDEDGPATLDDNDEHGGEDVAADATATLGEGANAHSDDGFGGRVSELIPVLSVAEAFDLTEEMLAVARHVAYPAPDTVAQCLLVAGSARAAVAQGADVSDPDGLPAGNPSVWESAAEAVVALVAAIQVSTQFGSYDRAAVRKACLVLVRLMGAAGLQLPAGVEEDRHVTVAASDLATKRLKFAIVSLVAASRFKQSFVALRDTLLTIADEVPVLPAEASTQIEQVLQNESAHGDKSPQSGVLGEESGASTRHVLNTMLSLLQERSLMPPIVDCGSRQSALLLVHLALMQHLAPYRTRLRGGEAAADTKAAEDGCGYFELIPTRGLLQLADSLRAVDRDNEAGLEGFTAEEEAEQGVDDEARDIGTDTVVCQWLPSQDYLSAASGPGGSAGVAELAGGGDLDDTASVGSVQSVQSVQGGVGVSGGDIASAMTTPGAGLYPFAVGYLALGQLSDMPPRMEGPNAIEIADSGPSAATKAAMKAFQSQNRLTRTCTTTKQLNSFARRAMALRRYVDLLDEEDTVDTEAMEELRALIEHCQIWFSPPGSPLPRMIENAAANIARRSRVGSRMARRISDEFDMNERNVFMMDSLGMMVAVPLNEETLTALVRIGSLNSACEVSSRALCYLLRDAVDPLGLVEQQQQ